MCVVGTGMKEFRIARATNKLLAVACEPVAEITAVNPSAYPHAANALIYIKGGGALVGTDAIVTEVQAELGAW